MRAEAFVPIVRGWLAQIAGKNDWDNCSTKALPPVSSASRRDIVPRCVGGKDVNVEIRCPGCAHPLLIPVEICTGDVSQTLVAIQSIDCPNCGAVTLEHDFVRTATFQPLEEEKNRRIAHFVLRNRLGGGGFGTVWLAEDVSLGRQVALKLPISEGRDATNLLHEAKTAASLRHPNIVSVYEVGSENGRAFIASEYIDGLTLRDLLSSGRPPIQRTVELLIAVAQALHHAHEHGVVHRDIKPANIILNHQGQPFVADFGIAKRVSADATISSEGQVVGTARYMSPEQASGKTRETDRRSDIYALGVLLFEMVTGDTPFRGNVRAQLHQKMFEEAPSPRKLDATLPKDLETICLKCLEREPNKRYQTALAVAEELERFAAGDPIHARPISTIERLWRRCRQYPVVVSLLTLLFLSLTLGLLGVSYFGLQSQKNAELTQRSLYRAQMNLTAGFLESGDIAGVRGALRRFGPDTPLDRLRGFEWYYFDRVASQVHEVANQGEMIDDVAVSRNGEYCAACGIDRRIRVWECKSGKLVRTLSLNSVRFRSLSFSPMNDELAAGSSDGMVHIWDPVKDDRVLKEMRHGPQVALVRYSPNGNLLLAGGQSGAVRIWDLKKHSLVTEIPSGMSGMKDARFSPDGEHVAVATTDGMLRLWKISSREQVHRYNPNPLVESLAFSDDGRTLVTGSSNAVIRVWSVEQEKEERSYELIWRIGDLEFLKDSRMLSIVSSGGDLHLFNVDTGHEINRLSTHNLSFGVLDRSPDGKVLAMGSGDGAVKLVRVDELLKPNVYWHEANIRAVDFLPHGKQVVAGSADGSAKIWNLETGESQELGKPTGLTLTSISVEPHGKLIAIGSVRSKATLWDRDTLQLVDTIPGTEAGVLALDFTSSGEQIVVAVESGPLLIFDNGDWSASRLQIAKQESNVNAIACSPDQNTVAVAYENGVVRWFDVLSGKEQRKAIQLTAPPVSLCYCERGSVLAIGTDVGEIELWDLKTNQMRHVMKGHSGRINALSVLPNGTTLVSGGRDHDVKLWDTETGERITVLDGHLRQVHCVAVSPDGNTLVTGGLEGDLRIWRTNPRHP